jgi:Fic family protein
MAYRPPYSLTAAVLALVAEISEMIGRYAVLADRAMTPQLRRENRLRTIQASLAIENNTLTLEQVTAVIDGKRVLGQPREIQEVRNAFAAYDAMERWHAASREDLLEAHRMLMSGLVDRPGAFRSGGVGIFREGALVHMAPPAERVPHAMDDLLQWLKRTDAHPLVASCVFHYEFEFIHPFEDGNGRMGRLWQTLILRQWKPLLAYLPVETVIREQQEAYYRVLAEADQRSDATVFVEFMLQALVDALREAISTDQVIDQVIDQVSQPTQRIVRAIGGGEFSVVALMTAVGLSHRPTFRLNYLGPAIADGWVTPTQPGSPRSPTQRYRLTERGRALLARLSADTR